MTLQSEQCKNLTVSDNKPVTVVATKSDPTVEEQVSRKQRDGSSIAVSCPQSIVLYNDNMGGVDNNDQLRGYYHVRLKCRKFYKYVVGYEKRDLVAQNAIFYRFSNYHHSIALRALGFPLGL